MELLTNKKTATFTVAACYMQIDKRRFSSCNLKTGREDPFC